MLLRIYNWLDQRLGIRSAILPVIEHPVPRKVNWWYVFGSATLTAFVFQVITGVVLAFAYVPAPNSAYDSLLFITHTETLGNIIRGIHYWGASAMVILISIHAARVFLMGSYKYPREATWLAGVVLLLLTLAMAFTGQLLRWDQDAYWAVGILAAMTGRVPVIGHILVHLVLAGDIVGGATLTRFYATHVFLIPAIMFGMIGLHLYQVVRLGISEPPEPGEPVDPKTYDEKYEGILKHDGIPFWPDAAWRDVVFALAIGVVVLALAIFAGPKELGPLADPTNIKADPRPDWYFLWLFALLALMPASLENYVMIGLPIVAGIILIAIPFISNKGERSVRRRPWALAIVAIPAVAILVLIRAGDKSPWSPVMPAPAVPATITAQLSGDQIQGAKLFQSEACLSCHTVAGTGGKRGPNLTSVGSRLSREQLTWRILNGGRNMPSYGTTLQPDQLKALVDFLQAQK